MPSRELTQALHKRDEALATMNVLAVELAAVKAARDEASGVAREVLQGVGDGKAVLLEAAIEALEEAQIDVSFWRAVERGRQSLG